MSVIKPRCIMKGFVVQFDKIDDYLPPDTSGWLRRYSVLMHPQAMDILGINPRQPVRVQTPAQEYIGVIWPCKELGVLRLCLTEENAAWEKLVSVTPIWNPVNLPQISVSTDPILPLATGSLQEYIQMYLTNSYIQPGIAIPMNYYGKLIQIVPDVPLELAMKDISLEDGELESEHIIFVPSDCTVTISSTTPFREPTDPLSAVSSIGGMHIAKKTLMDFVLLPYLRDKSCCSVLLWGLPGSGKTLLLSAVAKALGGSAFYSQVEVDVPMEEERIEILRSLTGISDDVIVELAK
ncbi:hypothetical protein COOONC_13502 [Cooperia oncophora]